MLLLGIGVAGCASPESRIRKNPDLFAQFSPEDQEKIRAGTIDIGFTAPMVQMALGQPSRVGRRTTESGVQEIWSFQELMPGSFSHAYAFDGLCPSYRTCSRHHCPFYHQAYRYPPESVERMRVTFDQNAVSEIEVMDVDRQRP